MGTSTPDDYRNIAQAFYANARAHRDRQVYSQAQIDPNNYDGTREWTGRTFSQVEDRVRRIAGYLFSLGIGAGDKVAIVSNSRPEWMEADLGILTLGAVSVSVYPSLTSPEIGYILFDSNTQVVFAENIEQLEKLKRIMSHDFDVPGSEDRAPAKARLQLKKIILFDGDASGSGETVDLETVLQSSKPFDLALVSGIEKESLASLVYTSGTTGPPKGVHQTHANHLANVRQAMQCGVFHSNPSLMLFLPLAHSFAKLIGYLGFLTPAELKFCGITSRSSSKPDPASWTRDIREADANIVPVVPRILEKMQSGIEEKALKGGLGGMLVRATLRGARAHFIARRDGTALSFADALRYRLTGGLRKKIQRALFGSDFWYAVSGGAKLPVPVGEFFESLGVIILEGYGLTETVVATNVNRAESRRIGSVGPVLAPDIELRIAEDGEILFRGPNVSKGYYNRPTATRQSWDDQGWFHTGDIGKVDQDGFLYITGRKKEIIVTAGGKKIPPESVETVLKQSPIISQAVLLGEGKPYCVALFTLNMEALKQALKDTGQIDVHTDQRVHKVVDSAVQKANEQLASYEQVKRFAILADEFTVDNGTLTPTFKVKRNVVAIRYKELIEGLYS
ncbi:MAG: long-chain fatty acid--CoA ligase [Bdellovibrionota bacterium]|nr:MAG: long-chain fatty acid--CoA ligase [Bdellovibrionota bacterium]